jgi:hypothetical protein
MKKELDERLVADFPKLYRDRNANMKDTCMCWGFTCGDGWEPLIRRLSEKLEPLIVGEASEVRAAQVKEKFGTLRFYIDGPQTIKMEGFVVVAEQESAVTCEVCGAPGKLTGRGWVRTLCPACEVKPPR